MGWFSHKLEKSKHIFRHNKALIVPSQVINIETREPRAADPTKPSIAQLPDPIVRSILTSIKEVRPELLSFIALLSSSLYAQARYVQHLEVNLDLNDHKHTIDRLHLIERLGQLVAIRVLRVNGEYYADDNDALEILENLAAMAPAMTGLRHVHWHVHHTQRLSQMLDVMSMQMYAPVPIPSTILATLPVHCRLHTSLDCHANNEAHVQTRAFLQRLVGSPSLLTLSVRILYIKEAMSAETMRSLTKVLLSCPNLTRIPKIHIWYPQGRCYDYGPEMHAVAPYTGIGFLQGERLAALEELGIGMYPWGREGALNQQGYRLLGSEQDYWINNFDWSRLTRLNGYLDSDLSRVVTKLDYLKQIDLTDSCNSYQCPNLLHTIQSPLELIIIPDWDTVGCKPDPINQFGKTLKELKIGGRGPQRATAVTAFDLTQLSKELLHLETLSLDVEWDRGAIDWPYDHLNAIATFPCLRSAELWFPLKLGNSAPHLTYSAARDVFCYLRRRNDRIQRLTLHSGVPTPNLVDPLSTFVDPTPSWSMRNSVSFVCEAVYDDEGPKVDGQECRISVWCQELSVVMNAKLRKLDQQTNRELPDVVKLDPSEVFLRAALDGPLDSGEWNAWRKEQLRRYGPIPGSVDEMAKEIDDYWARMHAPFFSPKWLLKDLYEYAKDEFTRLSQKHRERNRSQ